MSLVYAKAMQEATVVYPHQLFAASPAVVDGRRVYLVEEPLLLTHNPIHRQKLMLHKLSMDAYERCLTEAGHAVTRLSIANHPTSAAVFERLKQDGITTMHIVDTTDDYLERAIADSGIERVWYESPLFLLPKAEAMERYHKSGRFMAKFYKQLRQDKNILVNDKGEPTGGQWSFDEENRRKIPKGIQPPEDLTMYGNAETDEAEAWAAEVPAEQYGEAGCWLPYTHAGAEKFLQEFFCARFTHFGTYEDAIAVEHTRLWHSTLSPLINIGLLTPQHVLDKALAYAQTHDTPLNSLEGFVRQILGWREFIRASYECDGHTMRTQNFWGHTRALPSSFWDGSTNILPLDITIKRALSHGYTHHIERLMIMGNFMLLTATKPNDVYRWFMGMYLDAYDWVMVPNVYGMSQFADGGSFATKPYISGSNYLKKMSDYQSGPWEDAWTALYWHFIATHREVFEKNHRLAMMPKLLDKMDEQKRTHYMELAAAYLNG